MTTEIEQLALGCANSAAMRAIDAASLAALNSEQLQVLIVKDLDGNLLANDAQLSNWFGSEIAGAGLGDLGELAGWWKKLRHAVSSVTKKIIKVAVAPIKAVVNPNWKKIAKYAPQAIMGAAGLLTLNPGMVAGAASSIMAQKQARAQQEQAQAEYDAQAQAQADAQAAAYSQAQSYTSPGWPDNSALVNSGQMVRAANGQLIRLPQPAQAPQVVGLNVQGIMDNIKSNPLPWVIGGGVLVLALRR